MKRDWREAREKVELEGACRNCGDWNPQAAHTIPRSLGGRQLPESVIPLCLACHSEQHAGRLDLLPLLHRDEEVEAVQVLGIARAYRYLGGDLATEREEAA